MRLYFLKTTDAYRKGFVHEIPDDEAKALVVDGVAQEAAPGQRHDLWSREEPEFPPGLDEHLDEIYKRMTHLRNAIGSDTKG